MTALGTSGARETTCRRAESSLDAALRRLILFALLGAAVASDGAADDVRPVQVQLREREPGVFLVQWQVPKLIPVEATPRPVLPDGCRAEGEHVVRDQTSAWIHRQVYRCPDGLSGRALGIDYPFFNTNLSTVFRVSLLSGEQHARILAPGEDTWSLPEGMPDVLQVAERSVLFGVEHVFESAVHLALVAVFCLLGGGTLTGRFALGQLVAILLASFGLRLQPELGEIGLAIAVSLLARQALALPEERRQVLELAGVAGLVHGLGLASLSHGATMATLALSVLGMDATLLVIGALLLPVLTRGAWRKGLAYGLGVLSVALALGSFFVEPVAVAERASALPGLSTGGVGAPASRRLARGIPNAPFQSFVAIEPFETRHEILVRLKWVLPELGDTIESDDQASVKDRVAAIVLAASGIEIDGKEREALLDRVDFVTVDPQGVLSRPVPVRETLEDAFVGVTLAYPTTRVPRRVVVSWNRFIDKAPAVPLVLVDPEATRTASLTPEEPTVSWENALTEDPIPKVSAVAVEPRKLPVPLASIPIVLAAGLALAKRKFRWARVALAVAVLAGPIGEVALAVPSSGTPSKRTARRILAGLLPNVYRAFELRDESMAYDRLAVSVTGDTLTEVYLENRRALEMVERGGARARVEAVEVQDVDRVTPAETGGFDAVASWTVGGTVTHFGHRHFRENRYHAEVRVVPVEDAWKIHTIEVLEEERVR